MTIDSNLRAGTPESQLVLLLDDDQMVTDGLAAGLERQGRTLITCNDVESAEMMVERFHPSHIVADVRISSQFACEGLDFVRFAQRHTPDSRVILMSGHVPDALQLEASERGAVAFLQKPFEIRELDSILDLMSSSLLYATYDDGQVIRVPMISDILRSGRMHPFFQPIVALDGSDTRIGYESLARYQTSSPLRDPELLFKYAQRKDRVAELEFLCVETTLAVAHAVPASALLFMNLHPDVFRMEEQLGEAVIENARRNGFPLDRIVLEITDHGALLDTPEVFATIDYLRDLGVRFALDDVGVAYSRLPLIGKLRPSFLKISQHFGTGFENDHARTKLVTNIVSLASGFGCDVIIEGVEDRSTADAATELHVPFAQGYLFGRPAAPDSFAEMSCPVQ